MTNQIAFGMSYPIKLPVVVLGTIAASLSMSGGSVLAAHLAGGIDRGGLRTPMLNEGYLAYLPNPKVEGSDQVLESVRSLDYQDV